jgi:hypothetical protein
MATKREIELNHQLKMRKLQLYQDLSNRAVPVLCCLIIGASIYFSIRELAGRNTFTDIAFRFAADLKANKPIALMVSWVLTAICGAWGAGERFLRRRYIKEWHPIVKRYQLFLDPKRGSSSLTEKGTTRPEDI